MKQTISDISKLNDNDIKIQISNPNSDDLKVVKWEPKSYD